MTHELRDEGGNAFGRAQRMDAPRGVEREVPAQVVPTRRGWVAPELARQASLTTMTQVASLLFLQSSSQCFDANGNPVPC